MYDKPTNAKLEEIWDWNLTNHKPTADGMKKMEALRELAKDFCEGIIKLCPESRERSIALTNLEQTVMYTMAAIARFETEDGENPGAVKA